MGPFDINSSSEELLSIFLRQLNADRKKPSLNYLDELIFLHQHTIPFETYTRILDYHEHPESLPSIEAYIKRLPDGTGGVCWTLARGFHWLLSQLGFATHYLLMEPGHVCLAVKIEEEYHYADVGYAAPFFKSYPLKQSFEVTESWEKFSYSIKESLVEVSREPGPSKSLGLTPIAPEDIRKAFRDRNIWGTNRFLTTLTINKFIDKKLIRLKGDVLYDYRSGKLIERQLNKDEVPQTVQNLFKMSPRYYLKAQSLLS